jgi:hypothetical protein
MKVRYSYLGQQFADPDPILAEIKKLVATMRSASAPAPTR